MQVSKKISTSVIQTSAVPTSNASVTSATSHNTAKSIKSQTTSQQQQTKAQSTPNSNRGPSQHARSTTAPRNTQSAIVGGVNPRLTGQLYNKFEDDMVVASDEDSLYDETKEKEHAINRAKVDLMQLGIELDDDIIERLQKNLKIEKIFQIAHQASKIMMKKPANLALPGGVLPPGSPNTNMNSTLATYRNVANPSSSTPTKGGAPMNAITAIAGDHPIVSILNPKETIQSDEKHAVELLLKLENRQNDMEPQHRPMIENVIEKFRLQYARYPEKFICRLLGQKLPSTTAETLAFANGPISTAGIVTAQSDEGGGPKGKAATRAAVSAAINEKIMQWILQKRYITQIDFQTMLSRVLPTHLDNPQEVSAILFKLLAETKRFQSNKKKEVVDLWGFLTFLKVASDESRRSYDARTSRLATDIEFWKKDNGQHVVISAGSSSGNTRHVGKIVKKYPDYSQDPVSIIVDPSQAPTSSEIAYPAKKNPDGRIPRSFSASRIRIDNKKPLAELLGQPHHEHCSKTQQGRNIMGTFHHETVNSCDIPTALHSPPRYRPKSPGNNSRAVLNHRALQDEHQLPIPPPEDMLDSRKVAYLLNQKELMKAQGNVTTGACGKRGSSANTLVKEQLNNTTVASALGREFVPPPSPAFSADAHLHTNWSLTGHTTARPRSQSQSRRMNLSCATNLYWETEQPPSVAAALGGNPNYLKRNSLKDQ